MPSPKIGSLPGFFDRSIRPEPLSAPTRIRIDLQLTASGSQGKERGNLRLMKRCRKRGRSPCFEHFVRTRRKREAGKREAGLRQCEKHVTSPRSFRQTANAVSGIRRKSPRSIPKLPQDCRTVRIRPWARTCRTASRGCRPRPSRSSPRGSSSRGPAPAQAGC